MDPRELISLLRKSPDILVLREPDYFTLCAFVNGYGHGREPYELTGFYEWLNMQFPRATSAHWSELVLQLAFPQGRKPTWMDEKDLQDIAITCFLNKLELFFSERDSNPDGLVGILRRHKDFEIRTRKAVRDRETKAQENPT